MSTTQNKNKKSTDTKPKGEVKNINTTTKGLFDYHKEKNCLLYTSPSPRD